MVKSPSLKPQYWMVEVGAGASLPHLTLIGWVVSEWTLPLTRETLFTQSVPQAEGCTNENDINGLKGCLLNPSIAELGVSGRLPAPQNCPTTPNSMSGHSTHPLRAIDAKSQRQEWQHSCASRPDDSPYMDLGGSGLSMASAGYARPVPPTPPASLAKPLTRGFQKFREPSHTLAPWPQPISGALPAPAAGLPHSQPERN